MKSHKQKIYALVAVYLVGCAILFLYGFNFLDNSNAATAKALDDQRTQLNDLQNEQRSFKLGNQDLDTMSHNPQHPDNFFSKDVKVVNEIKTLENLSQDTGVKFQLNVAGTADTGSKTPGVKGEILSIPYSVTLSGAFSDVVNFLERMEHLSFVTHVRAISLGSVGDGNVNAVFSATFFITK